VTEFAFQREVGARVFARPYLIPIFDHVLDIPRRLREINPSYYVAFNVIRIIQKAQGLHYKEWTPVPDGVTPRYNGWYEVHKLTAPPWLSAGVCIPFGTLDARALRYVWERDTEYHGAEVFRRLDEANERRAASLARKRRNVIEAMTRDSNWGRSYFGPGGPGRLGDLQARKPAPRLYVPV